jgi:hypothetical protein
MVTIQRKAKAICLAVTWLTFLSCSQGDEELDASSRMSQTSDAVAENPAVEEASDGFELIGGTIADPTVFPASVYISAQGGRCTATIVGGRTVISAAHCMNNGATISFSVGPNRYSAVCRHHPNYSGNSTADWALCKTNQEVIGTPFESLNQDAALIKKGQRLLLTGYGCTRAGGSGGNDGRYRVGEATVTTVPSAASTNHDIVTKGGGALCFGDSGGPAFLYLDAAKKERVLVGINSRGDIATTSYISSLSQVTAQNWVKSWMDLNQVKICGVSNDATGCRGGAVLPPIGGETEVCKKMIADGALDRLVQCTKEQKPDLANCRLFQDSVMACIESK